jgi:hypothetical protein
MVESRSGRSVLYKEYNSLHKISLFKQVKNLACHSTLAFDYFIIEKDVRHAIIAKKIMHFGIPLKHLVAFNFDHIIE